MATYPEVVLHLDKEFVGDKGVVLHRLDRELVGDEGVLTTLCLSIGLSDDSLSAEQGDCRWQVEWLYPYGVYEVSL